MWLHQTSSESLKTKLAPWKRNLVIIGIAVFVISVILAGVTAYAAGYRDRVIPGVRVGGVDVGGYRRDELTGWLHAAVNRLSSDGIQFDFETTEGSKSFTVYPVSAYEDISQELVRVDVSAEVERLLGYGKDSDIFVNSWRVLQSRFKPAEVRLRTVVVDEEKMLARVKEEVAVYEEQPQSATMRISTIDPLVYEITSSTPGVVFEHPALASAISDSWSRLAVPRVRLMAVSRLPQVHESDIVVLSDDIERVVGFGGLEVSYENTITRESRIWNVSARDIADWLTVSTSDGTKPMIDLDDDKVVSWVTETIAEDINVPAQNARFQIGTDGKVTEFQGSRTGISLDVEATAQRVEAAIVARVATDEPVRLVETQVSESVPDVSTSDVNDLGITDILGVGISRFVGSPANRVINIKNGAAKINGLLIKPGEEFSTVERTQPYTIESGYVPELVIQGNKVEPALGGGLCQISTTLFRMAMNSGLDIIERRNHSLLVAYYNDLTNGLPGTDATIFEPKPDFRFKNDTDNYVLIQADVDEKKSELRLTLWGTKDGRKASYSEPVVKRWIPYGPTRTTETTTLAPGVTKCQNAYTGAEASFVYTRVMPNGEQIDRVFDSYYRPLPKICLVGATISTSTPATPLLSDTLSTDVVGGQTIAQPENES